MIPEFPEFKVLEFSDKESIERITEKFQPYSDFNFTSLWSWNINGEMRISILNDSLAVRFNDYITGEPFYSFLGGNKTNDTVAKLIELSTTEGLKPFLKLVPEISTGDLNTEIFNIAEDKNNFDYILSVEKLMSHDGTKRKLSTRRKLINEFKKRKDFELSLIDIRQDVVKNSILNVFEKWESQLDIEKENVHHLEQAISKLLQLNKVDKILSFGVYLNKILVGYSINEILPHGYVVGHFQQANLSVLGSIYALLMQEVADYVVHLGSKYINIEQDLGIDALKQWKSSYNPVFFLKKYTVSIVDKSVEM